MVRHSSLDCDPRLLAALGSVTVDFSALDASVQLAISIMLMPDDLAVLDATKGAIVVEKNAIVTSEMSFKQRVYAFASLYRQRWPRPPTEFEFLCKQLHDAEDLRNQLVHSYYDTDATGAVVRRKVTAKTKQGLRSRIDIADAQEVEALAENLRALAEDVLRFALRKLVFVPGGPTVK